jgi:hypothetical protein
MSALSPVLKFYFFIVKILLILNILLSFYIFVKNQKKHEKSNRFINDHGSI